MASGLQFIFVMIDTRTYSYLWQCILAMAAEKIDLWKISPRDVDAIEQHSLSSSTLYFVYFFTTAFFFFHTIFSVFYNFKHQCRLVQTKFLMYLTICLIF